MKIAAVLAFAAAAVAATASAAVGDGLVEAYKGKIRADDRVIARGFEPATSPDGSRIAYIGIDGDLYVAGTDGRDKTRLTKTEPQEGGPAWSPDGRTIAYTRVDGLLYRIDVASRKSRLIGMAGSYFTPTYSPDGRKIAFSFATDAFNSDIYVANANGTNARRLTHTQGTHDRFGEESAPDYSPDGRTIVFVSNRTGNSELWVMRANGASERRITSTARIDEARPRYSRDGTRLLYLQVKPLTVELAVSSANGGRPRALGKADGADWR